MLLLRAPARLLIFFACMLLFGPTSIAQTNPVTPGENAAKLDLLFGPTSIAQPTPVTPRENAAKLDALADEVNQLRESLAIPETDGLLSSFGMGPAASKVYNSRQGISFGGYGEFYFGHYFGDSATRAQHRGDVYRFIQYMGYKFSDRVLMNAEIEFEHATTGTNEINAEKGSVSVEFVYLDFLTHPAFNLRTGLMLMPMGIVNEMHEPTTYRGNMRPETERRIIPSTFRSAGFGIFGEVLPGLSYKAYLTNGLAGTAFDKKGIRGGRQKGNHFVWEDKAVVAQLMYRHGQLLEIGGSFFYSGADHDPTGTTEISAMVVEGHSILRWKGAELRGLVAMSRIEGASTDVPTGQLGFYVEGSYDILPSEKWGPHLALRPFVRYENLNLQSSVSGSGSGLKSLHTQEITGGLEFSPHRQVVIKAEFSHKKNAEVGSEANQEMRVGAGFIY